MTFSTRVPSPLLLPWSAFACSCSHAACSHSNVMRCVAMADHGFTALQQQGCCSCEHSVLSDDGRGALRMCTAIDMWCTSTHSGQHCGTCSYAAGAAVMPDSTSAMLGAASCVWVHALFRNALPAAGLGTTCRNCQQGAEASSAATSTSNIHAPQLS